MSSLTFDVALHVGTMFAVLGYFWREWALIAASGVRDLRWNGLHIGRWHWRSRLGLSVAVGTGPAVLAGWLFEETIRDHLREAWIVGLALVVFAVVIAVADRLPMRMDRLSQLAPHHALTVGLMQAVALIPGVSRSGITISAARALGFDRPTAARFSFLLSAPAVLAAAVLQAGKIVVDGERVAWGPLLVGIVVSGVAGALVIHALLRYLHTRTLRPFAWYRIALGAAVLAIGAARVL